MRADRLISILLLLQLRSSMTAKELAEELEVSERTIYRDMDALGSAGVPIQAESGLGGGFSLPPDYRTKADGLNKSDIQALFLLMNEQPFKQLGFGASLKSALLKIRSALPDRLQADAEWIQNRILIDMDGWSRYREQERFLRQSQQAVWEQHAVVIRYTDRTRKRRELEVEPYGLVLKAGFWFLAGRIADGEIAAFRLSRIDSMRLTERGFDRAEAFRLEPFWRAWTEQFERRPLNYETVLEADRQALESIARRGGWVQPDEKAAESVAQTAAAPGACGTHRVFFENEDAAASAVLAELGAIRVVSPPSLRARLRAHAMALSAVYEDD